jgi:hypothetical protein
MGNNEGKRADGQEKATPTAAAGKGSWMSRNGAYVIVGGAFLLIVLMGVAMKMCG